MRVGIDTYSYHRFFGEIREGEEDPGTRWTTWDFLDRAVELRVDGVSLETCYLDLHDPAFRNGWQPACTKPAWMRFSPGAPRRSGDG